MSRIEIRKINIVELETDAVVNAANSALRAGGGVCGAIFAAAGYEKLQEACDEIGHCETGSAVITPGFNLRARYVIHAVGPIWKDGRQGEPELLYQAYEKALELAARNECHSIGFPLISAGIYGYPVRKAWDQALKACRDFISKHPDYSLDIVFAVLDERILETGQQALLENVPEKLRVSGQEFDVYFFHKPEGPNGYLSNWYLSPFELDGIRYSCSEQYIMHRKCLVFGDLKSAEEVLAAEDPARQQQIGRSAAGYNGHIWAGVRQMVLYRGLMAKFSQNEELKERLLSTGNSYLVECKASDKIWACGIPLTDDRRFDADNWTGDNIQGFALMAVREVLG